MINVLEEKNLRKNNRVLRHRGLAVYGGQLSPLWKDKTWARIGWSREPSRYQDRGNSSLLGSEGAHARSALTTTKRQQWLEQSECEGRGLRELEKRGAARMYRIFCCNCRVRNTTRKELQLLWLLPWAYRKPLETFELESWNHLIYIFKNKYGYPFKNRL